MSAAQYCVSWDSYKNNVSNGLSRLQQNGEFVDMTLAAEGHLVKVHRNIVALASPYIKAMIQSAECPHPVLFLNNISHKTLAYILEYIYIGEVKVSNDDIASFIDTCKSLGIAGVENFVIPKKNVRRKICEEPSIQQEAMAQQDSKSQVELQTETSLDVLLKTQADLLLERQSKQMIPETQQETLPDLPVEVLSDSPIEVCPYSGFNDEPQTELEREPESQLKVISESEQLVLPQALTDSQQEILSKLENILPSPDLGTVTEPQSQDILTESQLDKMPVINLEAIPQLLPGSLINSLDTGPTKQSTSLLETQPKDLPELLQHEIERVKDPPENNFAAHITINNDNNYNLEFKQIEHNIPSNKTCPIMTVDNFVVNYNNSFCEVDDNATANLQPQPLSLDAIDNMNLDPTDTPVNNKRNIETNTHETEIKQNLCFNLGVGTVNQKKQVLSKVERDKIVHYTVSNRGSLQLMLNCYIYCCHHHSCGGIKRRWRCADYRKLHCPALIDTENDEIINRSDQHNHASHDSKILRKFKSKLIFTSVVQAEETCKALRVNEAKAAEPEYFKPKTKRRKFIA